MSIFPAVLPIHWPTAVEPVNEIAGIPGCSTIALPQGSPVPWTMFITSLGSPACSASLQSMYAVTGVTSEGLATHVLPVAKTGAIFHDSRYNGRFQGEIRPATPRGLLNV